MGKGLSWAGTSALISISQASPEVPLVRVTAVDITRLDPRDLDLDLADRLAEIDREALDGLPLPAHTGPALLLEAQVGDGEGPDEGVWVAREGDEPVGYGVLTLSRHENTGTARLRGGVHPDYQGRGIGRALLSELSGATARPRLRARAWVGTAGEAALPRLGFEAGQTHVVRRLDLDGHHDDSARLRRDASAVGYEFSRHRGPTPRELLGDMVVLREAINDAPEDGDYEAYPPERITAYENALAARRQTQYTVLARHAATGEAAGISFVCVDEFAPSIAFQEDTSVVRAHRGRRLGLRLKLEMADWLRAERPEVIATDTWNARGNHHMIAVNERLGLRVVAENTAYSRARA
jgi:GNAT superfamily N-acetyltransferase